MKNLMRHLLWRRQQQEVDDRIGERLDRLKSAPSSGRDRGGVERLNRLVRPASHSNPRFIELSDKLT